MNIRLNIGCGNSPIPGWENYDNSPCVLIAQIPLLAAGLSACKALSAHQVEFVEVARQAGIRHANAIKRIPKPSSSVDALYSSHMLEHLSFDDAHAFLKEARRVLKPGGLIRLAVPDLDYHVQHYLTDGSADGFMQATDLGRLREHRLRYLFLGERQHQWMYNERSLCLLLQAAGFSEAQKLDPGQTCLEDYSGLDLFQGAPESLFVEARKLAPQESLGLGRLPKRSLSKAMLSHLIRRI